MEEEQARLTVLNMEDDDENLSYTSSANSSIYQTPPQSTASKDAFCKLLLDRLESRGIRCTSKPSRDELVAHLRKHYDSFKPTLEWLHGNGLIEYVSSKVTLRNLCSLAPICSEHETTKLDYLTDRDRAKNVDDTSR